MSLGYNEKEIAKNGLALKAIKLSPDKPFVWASGFQMPIYNDNRMFLQNGSYRKSITCAFEDIIKKKGIEYDIIAGTSTAGIPHATTLSDRTNAPLIYVRDKPKDHGLRNQIEGIDAKSDLQGKRIVLIEDLISTGGSSARAVQAFDSLDPKCEVHPILTYDHLLKIAKETGYIDEQQAEMLAEWRADPFGWGEKHGFPKIEKGDKK